MADSPRLVSELGSPLLPLINGGVRPAPTLSQAKKILVIRLDGLGDALMTVPFLRELRRSAPHTEISLVVKPAVAELLALCPYVDRIHTYESRVTHPRWGTMQRHARALRFVQDHVWGKGFDLAIVPRWDNYFDHEHYLGFFTAIPDRVGYAEAVTPAKAQNSAGSDRLFTRVFHDSIIRHEVEYSLRLLQMLGGNVENDEMELWLSPQDRARASAFLERAGVGAGELIVGLGVGASLPRRVWPVERFIRVARELRNKWGVRLVVVGGPGEAAQAREFEREMAGEFLNAQAEGLSIRETAALLERCHLYVGNNTGPMHLAAIFKVPVIEMSCHPASDLSSNDNSPQRFKSWKTPGVVLQPAVPIPPCQTSCVQLMAHCINGIGVAEAFRECDRWLERLAAKPRVG